MGEVEDALRAAKDARWLYRDAKHKRGESEVLRTIAEIHLSFSSSCPHVFKSDFQLENTQATPPGAISAKQKFHLVCLIRMAVG